VSSAAPFRHLANAPAQRQPLGGRLRGTSASIERGRRWTRRSNILGSKIVALLRDRDRWPSS